MGLGSSFGIAAETGNNIQTDGLVFYVDAAYKKSYSGSGNTVVDLVNSNTGTSSSSPTFNAGGYWEFDSSTSDDFIFSTNPLHSNSVTSFTVSTWINLTLSDHNGGIGVIVTTAPGADPSGGGFWIGYDDRNATHSPAEGIAWNCRTAGGYQRGKSNDNTISNDTWHHIALVLDQQATLYIDGVSSTNRTQDSSGNYTTRNNELSIGSVDDNSYGYKGLVSNVLLYDRGLTSSDILQNYNAQKERFGF